jgi:hypothetical protein
MSRDGNVTPSRALQTGEFQTEDTYTDPIPIEPAAAPVGAAEEKVAFLGQAFTLNAKDYEGLRKRCFALQDFHGAVQTMDQILAAEMAGKPKGKIYAALNSKMFAKHEFELRVRAERAAKGKPSPASRRGRIVLGGAA